MRRSRYWLPLLAVVVVMTAILAIPRWMDRTMEINNGDITENEMTSNEELTDAPDATDETEEAAATDDANDDEESETGAPETETAPTPQVRDYFPVAEGNRWIFAGEGSEYAFFMREIWFVDGERVQMIEDNPGTQTVFVLRVTGEQVVQVFAQEEYYERDNLLNEGFGEESDDDPDQVVVLLQAPLHEGAHWGHGSWEHRVTGVDLSMIMVAGVFTEVIRVSSAREGSLNLIHRYYAPGVGLIKVEFMDDDGETVLILSELADYDVQETGMNE
ncbi:MAG: hypothetical protein WD535_02545 [Thermaerobacterales bacterium]